MRIGTWARLLLAATPLVAGCGNFWQAPSTGGGSGGGSCTTNCTTGTSGNFYILNNGTTPQVIGEVIESGSLKTISGSPWTLPNTPYAMSIAPTGGFLTVSTLSGVVSYPISSGVLGTAVTASGDLDAAAIQVDKTGTWLVEAKPGTNGMELAAVPISSSTGAGTSAEYPISIAITNAAVKQLVISPDNSNIFVALGQGGTIVVPFNAKAATGSSPLGTSYIRIPAVNATSSALSVAVDPDTTPRLFYIGETNADSTGASGALRAFVYSTLGSASGLTQATGSPIASGGLAPNFVLPDTSGDYVYVANGAGASTAGNIAGFTLTVSGSSYTLTSDTTVQVGVQPLWLAEDSSSTFVFEVGSLGSPYFDSFTFDTTTAGQLDSQITSSTSATPIAIVAAP